MGEKVLIRKANKDTDLSEGGTYYLKTQLSYKTTNGLMKTYTHPIGDAKLTKDGWDWVTFSKEGCTITSSRENLKFEGGIVVLGEKSLCVYEGKGIPVERNYQKDY